MAQKAKFKPTVTKVKLNPEQAVLACGCYKGANFSQMSSQVDTYGCLGSSKTPQPYCCKTVGNVASS